MESPSISHCLKHRISAAIIPGQKNPRFPHHPNPPWSLISLGIIDFRVIPSWPRMFAMKGAIYECSLWVESGHWRYDTIYQIKSELQHFILEGIG